VSVLGWVRLGVEIGAELWREHRRAKAAERAQRAWAETPAPVRSCAHCGHLAYQPGQTRCYRCGGREFKS